MIVDYSVVIPHYRVARRELQHLVRTMLASISDSAELVIVDNNDTPIDLGVEAPNLVALHEPTPGSYAARNAGARAARGKILVFTDVDCIPGHGWPMQGLSTLESVPHCFVGGDIVSLAPTNIFAEYDAFIHMQQEKYALQMGFCATANLLVDRSVFFQVGPFDAELFSGGDRDWCERARLRGVILRFEKSCVVRHVPRNSLFQLSVKARRLAGQNCIRVARGLENTPSTLALEMRLYRKRRKRCMEAPRAWQRRAFMLIAALLQLIRVFEVFRILVGGKPERR